MSYTGFPLFRRKLVGRFGEAFSDESGGRTSGALLTSRTTAKLHRENARRRCACLPLLKLNPLFQSYVEGSLTEAEASRLQESLSVSRTGVMLPADDKPSTVFKRLFITGSPDEVAQQTHRLAEGRSIMDLVSDEARRLQQQVSSLDGERLDEYFTSVREVEQRLHASQEWATRPKPKVSAAMPTDIPNIADFVGQTRLMFDLMQLALESDSTRIITFRIQGQQSVPPLPLVNEGWHNLSHHGKDPEKLKQLHLIELEQMKLIGGF